MSENQRNQGNQEEEDKDKLLAMALKQLLQDVEASSKGRHNFNLADHCNSNTKVFDEKGSVFRRRVQRRWSKIKERTIKGYLELLQENNVVPGPITLEEFKQYNSKKNKMPSRSRVTTKNKNVDDDNLSTSTPLASDEDADDSKPTAASSRSSHSGGTRNSRSQYTPDPSGSAGLEGVPPVVQYPDTPESGVFGSLGHRFGFTSPLTNAVGQTSTPGAFLPLSSQVKRDGTRQKPWLIEVNTEFPERNNGFRIELVKELTHGGYTRSGFQIRRSVSSPDADANWQAYIPEGNYPASYSNRLVMVQGPSIDWCDKASQGGNADGTKCDMVCNTLNATSLEIENDPDRHHQYWMLVFPPGVVLNNQIFSDDDYYLPVIFDIAFMKHNNQENPFRRDIREIMVCWNIALQTGRRFKKGSRKQNLSHLFKE